MKVNFLKHDAEKLLLWLIGSAIYNFFLVYDVLTSQLIFGNVTAAVLILIWTSVLFIYCEFAKDNIIVEKQQEEKPAAVVSA